MKKAGLLLSAMLFCANSSFAADKALSGVAVNPFEKQLEHGLRGYYVIKGQNESGSLLSEMRRYKIPGVSIAAIHDGRYVLVKAYGYKDSSTRQLLTPEDLLQAASISKPITVLGALKLASEGKFDLDANINNYMTDKWRLGDNQYTKTQPVTARLLMAHLGGINVAGFPGIDRSVSKLPTIVDVLNGKKPYITTEAVKVVAIPGSKFVYSGGGISILQFTMMNITKQDFASWMKAEVLQSFAMQNSTFEEPLPESYQHLASSAHDKDGIVYKGKYHSYPEEAAAGLWTNPVDLIGVLNHLKMAYYGHCSPLGIESGLFRQMFTPQKPTPFGLGFMLESTPDVFTFGHDGVNDGFQSKMIAFVTPHGSKAKFLDDALVVMTNSDNGFYIIDKIVNAFTDAYGINYHPPVQIIPLPLPKNLKKYVLSFLLASDSENIHKIMVKNNQPYLDWSQDGNIERLYYLGNNIFVTLSGYKLVYSWQGSKLSLIVSYQNNPSDNAIVN